ncbi:hypothetical protein AAVH_27360 [Aphelenchoides avenae]|nr:hypothetical protein AAVH_27360 [Aphelenchus avenae]
MTEVSATLEGQLFRQLSTTSPALNAPVPAAPVRKKRRFKRLTEKTNVAPHRLGALNTECTNPACKALHWSEERKSKDSFMDCCYQEKIHFDDPPEYPRELKALLERTDPNWRNFHDHIRNYNASVRFVSLNVNVHSFGGGGPYAFKIQGSVYTAFNQALMPNDGEPPTYGQLFVVDTLTAVDHRMNNTHNEGTVREIFEKLDTVLRRVNPFVEAYRMMKEVIEQQRAELEQRERSLGSRRPVPEPEVRLVFCPRRQQDPQTYNTATRNEVAAIFATDADGQVPEAYITVHERGREVRRIPYIDPFLEPMAFPLLLPHGTLGYTNGMPLLQAVNGRTEISRREYTCRRMSVRRGKFNPLHRAGKLFQEWAVMNFVFMEGDKLNWIRANQHTLRADAYGVQAFLQAAAVEQNANVGTAVILPASFIGSPRFWRNNFEDAMAIMRAHGVPDIFVTMTCDATWPEITDVIKYTNDDGTEIAPPSTDRPDIIACTVFDLKKDALLREVKKCFGELVAWIYVIEFQQRGLPHLHLVGTLEEKAKFRAMDDIDRSVLSQIPDQLEDPVLFDLVAKHHVHGPNCATNPRAMCKTPRGFCRWNFPKPYRSSTRVNEDGRVEYARPDNGRTYNFGSVDRPVLVTNRDVSSYCPRLLKLFECHVNVDLCFGSNAIKYLYKYCYKGYDRTKVALSVDGTTVNYDEPAHHVDARCVTAPEAMWRLLGKELRGKSHSVECLDVNLPGQNVLKYDLLATYFALCAQQDEDGELARSLYYAQISYANLRNFI